ncbi:MAG: UDP-glucose/GDP-mannose dehydrogenase family protein [Paludibacteraceae bacterium]|nr:UDP-glucose/GDP-mannose dehydrogenase family protein [Paludibacteraceae bacterium]
MIISIFGLGYVGCVGMGCMAQSGHTVIGVDVAPEKVERINSGKATIVEKDIDELIANAHALKLIRATHDYKEAVLHSDISFLCVGTPSTDKGHLNLDYIYQTAKEIGEALEEKSTFHVVVIRSTVLPGTNDKLSAIIEKFSGKVRDIDFAVVSNPEFLREGTAVADYMNPPLTVLGSSCSKAIHIMQELYKNTNSPIEVVAVEVAELIKYVNNSYHALKVVFANEVGSVCKQLGVDSHEVMRIFCMDKQLNISPYYFKPGFAYGGSCLPKDLKALNTLAHDLYMETPVLNAIDDSNVKHLNRVVQMIEHTQKRKIGVLGLSFKAGTDDMRNSPIVSIIENLSGKGCEVRIYDKNVALSRLIGKNKSVITEKLPHLNSMLQDSLHSVLAWAEVLVVANKEDEFKTLVLSDNQIVIDLVRIPELEKQKNYKGLCW